MTQQQNCYPFFWKRVLLIALILLAVCVVIAIPVLFKTVPFSRTTSLIHLPQPEFEQIANDVQKTLLGSESIFQSSSLIDIVHMRGSVIMGNLIAIRLQDAELDSTILDSLTPDLIIRESSLRHDDRYPSWLESAWTDADGTAASFGALTRRQKSQDLVIWIWRPAARELILYCQPLHPDLMINSVHQYFNSADYQHETLHGFVGNDWREWRSVRFVPDNSDTNEG